MSDLNEDTIRNLAKLSYINVSEEEIADLLQSLKKIVDHAEKLQEIDLTHLAPYAHLDEQGIDSLRKDEIGECLQREVFLKNSPEHIGGMIRVPTVIKDV